MTRIKILEIYLAVGLIAVVFALLYVWTASPLGTSDKVGITTAISTVALVIATGIYAWHTRKMAEEMREQRYDTARPVVDIKSVLHYDDAITAGIAALERRPPPLACVLRNVGLGPAIDVYSFEQNYPSGERKRKEFGTLAKQEETPKEKLSTNQENGSMAIVAYYKDVYGRAFESSREVTLNEAKTGYEIGPLKTRQIKEDELP